MLGVKEEKPRKGFEFDLERKIKSDPSAAKKIFEKAEQRITEVKKHLREGANEKAFDALGTILHGYTALQKVLKKTQK